jgi:hypothetical protein
MGGNDLPMDPHLAEATQDRVASAVEASLLG